MAYHAVKRVKGHDYHYILQSYRSGGKVRSRILEYLGRDPDPKRLARALRYWGVESASTKIERKGRRRG